MPYCRKCGTSLPNHELVRFCPNCGAPVRVESRLIEPIEVFRTEKRRTSRRLGSIATAIILCLVVTYIGAILPIEPQEAQGMSQDLEGIRKAISSFGLPLIYGNNMMHNMIMFTPFFGSLYGLYVLFSTGRVLAAMALTQGTSPTLLFVSVFILPHAWLEYVSYAIALSESFWLTVAILRRRFRNDLTNLYKAMSASAILLLAAAFVEMTLITLA